jgi:hypothetical protein
MILTQKKSSEIGEDGSPLNTELETGVIRKITWRIVSFITPDLTKRKKCRALQYLFSLLVSILLVVVVVLRPRLGSRRFARVEEK